MTKAWHNLGSVGHHRSVADDVVTDAQENWSGATLEMMQPLGIDRIAALLRREGTNQVADPVPVREVGRLCAGRQLTENGAKGDRFKLGHIVGRALEVFAKAVLGPTATNQSRASLRASDSGR